MPPVWYCCPVTSMYWTTQTQPAQPSLGSAICDSFWNHIWARGGRAPVRPSSPQKPQKQPIPPSQPAHLTYLCSHSAPDMSPIILHSGNIQWHQRPETYFLAYLSRPKSLSLFVNRTFQLNHAKLKSQTSQHCSTFGDIIGQTIAFYCFEEELHRL